MNESQISVRYAKALFQSASEMQILERVYEDMELLSDTCKLNDFQYMLVLPYLQPSQKYNIVSSVLEKHISEISLSMIKLVITNKREIYLPGIAADIHCLLQYVGPPDGPVHDRGPSVSDPPDRGRNRQDP